MEDNDRTAGYRARYPVSYHRTDAGTSNRQPLSPTTGRNWRSRKRDDGRRPGILSALIRGTGRRQASTSRRPTSAPPHPVATLQLAKQLDEPACRRYPEQALGVGARIVEDAMRNAARHRHQIPCFGAHLLVSSQKSTSLQHQDEFILRRMNVRRHDFSTGSIEFGETGGGDLLGRIAENVPVEPSRPEAGDSAGIVTSMPPGFGCRSVCPCILRSRIAGRESWRPFLIHRLSTRLVPMPIRRLGDSCTAVASMAPSGIVLRWRGWRAHSTGSADIGVHPDHSKIAEFLANRAWAGSPRPECICNGHHRSCEATHPGIRLRRAPRKE